jgi:hypothetical protein
MGHGLKYIFTGDDVQCYKSGGAFSAIFELGARPKREEEHKTFQIIVGENGTQT